MTTPTVSEYNQLRPAFTVTRAIAQRALTWAQPLAIEALGIQTRRQTLVEGELPAYLVMTTPESHGGWGELMPVWFKPYERPVPLHCLDNWALFAGLYRSAFGPDANLSAFTLENLSRVIISSDLLIPFLPGTDGAGRFLRHGVLPLLLAILWLEPEIRDAWLMMHAYGARTFAVENNLRHIENLGEWLEHVENEAWLVSERERIAGETAVRSFLADADRARSYGSLFGGLCLGISALASALGVDWQQWTFQTINVAYRLPDFGLTEIAAWLSQSAIH